MVLKCTRHIVSTVEQIFDDIAIMAQPIGLVLFGASGKLTNEVEERILKEFEETVTIAHYGMISDTDSLVEILKSNRIVVIVLNAAESAGRDLRRKLVNLMRDVKMENVVGIYAKAKRYPIHPFISSQDKIDFNKQITAIEQSGPCCEGFDYYAEIEESGER